MRLVDVLAQEYDAIGTLVSGLDVAAALRPTGAGAWCVQDLLLHQLLDAQRALVTVATPSDREPDRDAATYWHDFRPDRGDGGTAHARFVRSASSAYVDPADLVGVWQVTSAAAVRAIRAAPPGPVATQGHVLRLDDFVSTLVVEATVHHLDLLVGLDGTPPGPEALAETRHVLERLRGRPWPTWDDVRVVQVGTGRRTPTDAEREELGDDGLPLLG